MNKIQKQNNASETDSTEQLPPSQQGTYTCVWRQLDAPTALDPVQCTEYTMKNKQKTTLQELTLSTAPKLRQWAAQPPYMDSGLELSKETVDESVTVDLTSRVSNDILATASTLYKSNSKTVVFSSITCINHLWVSTMKAQPLPVQQNFPRFHKELTYRWYIE